MLSGNARSAWAAVPRGLRQDPRDLRLSNSAHTQRSPRPRRISACVAVRRRTTRRAANRDRLARPRWGRCRSCNVRCASLISSTKLPIEATTITKRGSRNCARTIWRTASSSTKRRSCACSSLWDRTGVYDLVWTNHHAIIDGWSAARLLAEVLEDHEAFAADREPEPRANLPYGSYVRWLMARGDDETWWRAELARWRAPATVEDGIGRARRREPGTHHLRFGIDAGLGAALRIAAARARVTVHTVCQATWGLLLARYAGRAQAVFGSVVSGRPPELRK